MTYYNKVKVNWSRAVHIDESWDSNRIEECGLYFIVRRYIRNGVEWESPLYVGITTRNFYIRLNEHFKHNSKWLQAYGRKFIKFGKISIYNIGRYELKSLLTDIESSIIAQVEKEYPGELLNIQQKGSYNHHYNLFIEHINNAWLRE